MYSPLIDTMYIGMNMLKLKFYRAEIKSNWIIEDYFSQEIEKCRINLYVHEFEEQEYIDIEFSESDRDMRFISMSIYEILEDLCLN